MSATPRARSHRPCRRVRGAAGTAAAGTAAHGGAHRSAGGCCLRAPRHGPCMRRPSTPRGAGGRGGRNAPAAPAARLALTDGAVRCAEAAACPPPSLSLCAESRDSQESGLTGLTGLGVITITTIAMRSIVAVDICAESRDRIRSGWAACSGGTRRHRADGMLKAENYSRPAAVVRAANSRPCRLAARAARSCRHWAAGPACIRRARRYYYSLLLCHHIPKYRAVVWRAQVPPVPAAPRVGPAGPIDADRRGHGRAAAGREII